MGRDTLKLAHDSLFIEKIKPASTSGDAGLLNSACLFVVERRNGSQAEPFWSMDLCLADDVEALTTPAFLPIPLLWPGLIHTHRNHSHFACGGAAVRDGITGENIEDSICLVTRFGQLAGGIYGRTIKPIRKRKGESTCYRPQCTTHRWER